jgi:hypothetical protein
MKKFFYLTVILYGMIAMTFSSCELFEIDNYGEPGETLKGEILDVATGERVLTDQGSEGIRIRMRELSWSATAPSNFDFWCMKEGEFQNTKVFKGHYNVRVDGPFIPLVRVNQQGDTLADESKYIDIQGVTVANFEVQPFLKVEWVGEPTIITSGADAGKISVSVRVSRAVSIQDFRTKIEPMGGWNDNFTQVADVHLFIGESAYVGYRNARRGTSPYADWIEYSGNSFETNPGFGNTITLVSQIAIPTGRTVFVRVGARIRYQTEGQARYNYNEAKQVNIP